MRTRFLAALALPLTWLLLIVGSIVGGPATAGYVFEPIQVPGATFTDANGLNDAGQTVGLFQDATGIHGFAATGGVFTTIDVPGAIFTGANGINDAGQIVGEFGIDDAIGTHAFLVTDGVFTTIEPPGSMFFSQATDINNAGQIVGAWAGIFPTGGSFLATPAAFPEPSTLVLVASALLLGARMRAWGVANSNRPATRANA